MQLPACVKLANLARRSLYKNQQYLGACVINERNASRTVIRLENGC